MGIKSGVGMLLMLALMAAAQAANPRGIPEYQQKLEITYASSADAERATLRPAELPDGKKLAFSTRWDDSNNRHLLLAKKLTEVGWKATFYFYDIAPSWVDKKVPAEILKTGCSLGDHTVNHPQLSMCNPNGVFQQIMDMRMTLECAYDTTVTGFVLPGCNITTELPHDYSPAMIGDCLVRGGLLGGPEPWDFVARRYNLPFDNWFGGRLFSINDRKPDPELFAKGLNKGLKEFPKICKEAGPHLILGMHCWQDDAGLDVIKELCRKHAGNPEWWYCNENEYLAYRYEFFHARVKKLGVKGAVATYEITRIAPAELGARLPLTLVGDCDMVAARCDGREISAGRKKQVNVPHGAVNRLPQVIAGARLTSARREAALEKIPGVKVRGVYNAEANRVEIAVVNGGKETWENVSLLLRVPPQWKQGVQRFACPRLAPGETWGKNADLGETDARAGFADGVSVFYLQGDWSAAGRAYRLHTAIEGQAAELRDTPRDRVVLAGPLTPETAETSRLAPLSVAGAPLTALGKGITEQWRRPRDMAQVSCFGLKAGQKESKENWPWRSRVAELVRKQETCYLYVLEAETAAGKHYLLTRNMDLKDIRWWLDGEEIKVSKKITPLELSAGRHRILLMRREAVNRYGRVPGPMLFTISRSDNVTDTVPFREISLDAPFLPQKNGVN